MNPHQEREASAMLYSKRLKELKLPERVRSRSNLWIFVYALKPFAFILLGLTAAQLDILWITVPLVLLTFLVAQRHFQTLVHDASHFFYSKSPTRNDLLANWLAAGWIGMEASRYRKVHMKHHAYNGSKEDPEHTSFATVEADGGLPLLVVRYILGLEAFRLFTKYFIKSDGGSTAGARHKSNLAGRILGLKHIFICQAALLGLNVAVGIWWGYAVWLYLAVTWNPLLSRLRFLAEHPGEADTTVTTLGGVIENSYFAPQSFNYHLEHHGWPMIPPYRLRHLHRFLKDDVGFYADNGDLISRGYISKLVELAAGHRDLRMRQKNLGQP